MSHWRFILATAVHLLSVASVVYLCLPANRARVRAWQMFLSAVSGILLGLCCIEPLYVFPGQRLAPFPFDPVEEGANPAGNWFGLENFAFGVGVPLVALALWLLLKQKRALSGSGKDPGTLKAR